MTSPNLAAQLSGRKQTVSKSGQAGMAKAACALKATLLCRSDTLVTRLTGPGRTECPASGLNQQACFLLFAEQLPASLYGSAGGGSAPSQVFNSGLYAPADIERGPKPRGRSPTPARVSLGKLGSSDAVKAAAELGVASGCRGLRANRGLDLRCAHLALNQAGGSMRRACASLRPRWRLFSPR